jgi:hypothetical protein
MELVALVKHDCPVCDQVLPALDAAGVRVLSQSEPGETAAQAARLGLRAVPQLDEELELSARLDLEAVPALVLLDGESERGRVEGLHRARYAEIAQQAGVELALDGWPELRPGCASRTRELFLLGRNIEARRALEWGLVNDVVIGTDLEETALDWARELAANAPLSVQGNKRVIRELLRAEGELDPDVEAELIALHEACFASEDMKEGVRAFGEKRPARWQGR